MNARPYQRSFGGGVISPELRGRFDLLKYQTGLAEAVNMQILPSGAVQNRAGFQHVAEALIPDQKSRLIPFIYDQNTSYILELSDTTARVHTNGATVLEAAKTITAFTIANPAAFTSAGHGYATGDWVYSLYAAQASLHQRYFKVVFIDSNTFSLLDLWGVQVSTLGMTYAAGMTTARVYEFFHPYPTAALPELTYSQKGNQLIVAHPTYGMYAISRTSPTTFSSAIVQTTPGFLPVTTVTATAGGPGGGTPLDYKYAITVVDPDGIESAPIFSGTVNRDLTVAGNYNEISTDVLSSDKVCRVYRQLISNGASVGIAGYVGSFVPGTASKFRDYNIAPDFASGLPDELSTMPQTTDNAPAAVCHYDSRLIWGGTNAHPLRIVGTNTGSPTYAVVTHSPTRADDLIVADVISKQANRIKHLVPLDDLIAFTAGGEFKIFSTQGAMTNETIAAKPQSYVGANDVQPVVSNTSILYVSSKGAHIREMKFSWQQQAYEPSDISVMVPHFFDDYQITDLTLTRSPIPSLWAVRSDGKLLSMTYQPEHEIKAWTLHESDGAFESVCAVPEGSTDALYVLIRRTINGQTKRYLERLHTRALTHSFESFFVDSGLKYNGAPTNSISGLYHLEGRTVSILSNGAVQPPAVVVGGSVTFPDAGGAVQAGLPIESYINTLPLRTEAMAASAGAFSNIGRAHARVHKSASFKVGSTKAGARQVPLRTSEPYGSPPNLFTGEVDVGVGSVWGSDESLWVVQSDPLPLTVLSLGLELEH